MSKTEIIATSVDTKCCLDTIKNYDRDAVPNIGLLCSRCRCVLAYSRGKWRNTETEPNIM